MRFGLALLCVAAGPACGERDGDARHAERGARDPRGYVGMRTPPLPDGLEQIGGALLEIETDTVFAISHIQRDTLEMLWLEREVAHDGAESAFRVEDVLVLPRLAENEVLLFAVCRVNGRPDPGVVAIVFAAEDVEIFTDVRRVWRVGGESRRFEPMDAAGVDCANEGYGA